MTSNSSDLMPAQLLVDHWSLFEKERLSGPILDLACGDGHNGVFLATKGLSVICCDISEKALSRTEKLASENGVKVELWQVDLEAEETNPLQEHFCEGLLVFRFLHRPLVPCIRKALKKGGILVYETFTVDQPKFGKPRNPRFLLEPGELLGWFKDWDIVYDFEGVKQGPERAVAQVVCRKPDAES